MLFLSFKPTIAWVSEGAWRWGARSFFWCHPLSNPSFTQRARGSLPWLYPIQYSVVALAWHQTQTKDAASARSHHHGSQRVGLSNLRFKTSHPPNSRRSSATFTGRGLFLVWSTGNLPAVSVQSTRDDSGDTGWGWITIARGRHAHCIPIMATRSSPCGFSDTVYFIRYLPTAPCRVGVGATVRDAD